MIHVLTAHHHSARWIDIQLDYLRRNLQEPYRVVASLEGVSDVHAAKFDRVVPSRGRHDGKLNLLAAEAVAEGKPDDLLMFLDGDAFPIADPMPLVHKSLDETALVAVRRAENRGDLQPHPCFCVVSVAEWVRLRGDWTKGYLWRADDGVLTTDVGGNLLAALERTNTPWTDILRTNRVNPHEIWFAVYGDIVYHHGAGFRTAMSRTQFRERPNANPRFEDVPIVKWGFRSWQSAKYNVWHYRQVAENRRLGERIFGQIQQDPEFYRQFL